MERDNELIKDMPYLKWRVHLALLFSILLPACLGNSQTPVRPALMPTPSPVQTPTSAQTVFYVDRSALAYGIFKTEAIFLTMEVDNTTPDGTNKFADVSVEDGSGVHTYKLQSGKSSVIHNMPAGEKYVTITSGSLVKRNNEIKGVFIDRIIFDRPAVQVMQSNKWIVVYGDSLASGGRASRPSAEAWPVLLRKHYSVTVEAYGYRMLYDDATTPAERSAFASRLAATSPDFIWLAIGTNDYGLGPWSAQDFGEAYAATLDTIHSLTPRTILFAQSPILRIGESPNGFGDNLEEYRQQIASACTARSPWCIFVDGTGPAFPQPDELDKDGTHLTTQSSAKYADAVLDIIGK